MAEPGAHNNSGRARAQMKLREQRAKAGNLDTLIARLGLAAPADAGEILTIRALWRSMQRHHANQPIAVSDNPLLITSGWACHRRQVGGATQCFVLLLPGDFIVSRPRHSQADHHIFALTPVETVDASPLMCLDDEGSPRAPKARRAIAESWFRYEVLLLDHVFRVTGSDARSGLIDMLGELLTRLSATGRCFGNRFQMPVGQRPIAKIMGLSTVHVHNTLNDLRREGLVDFGRGWMEMPDSKRANGFVEAV